MGRRRFQMPSVERVEGKRAYWRIRYRADVLVGQGERQRVQKPKFLGYCPTTNDPEERENRGEITKRQAEKRAAEFLDAEVNVGVKALQSQILLKDFIRIWEKQHVALLGAAARKKYGYQVKNHILPDLGHLRMGDITSELVQSWLNAKTLKPRTLKKQEPDKEPERPMPLSWAAKTDLRGILSGVFHKAIDWGYWQLRNPVEATTAGKKRAKRAKQLLADADVARLVEGFPEFLVLLIDALRNATGCRVSEILGLEVRHVDWSTGWARIEQRWWRGDLDVVKTEKGNRQVYLGTLLPRLKAHIGDRADGFLFDRGDGRPYDDRDLMRDYVRARAKELGVYFEGLGFHSFRREFNTLLQELGASPAEAQLMLGWSKPVMASEYTVLQQRRVEELVKRMQERRSAASTKVVTFPEPKREVG